MSIFTPVFALYALRMGTKKANVAGIGCLALFGLPFAAVGTVMLYLTVSTILRSNAMQNWAIQPATLNSLELKTSSGKSKTHSVEVDYSYDYQGKRYTGKRASLYSADNIGTYHQDLYADLQQLKNSGAPFFVRVNPADPSESIIRNDLRLGILAFYMIFVATFGIVGWGLIAAAFFSYRSDKKRAELQALHPEEPWMWNEQWKSRRIRSMQKSHALVLGIAAIFWNAISLPATLAVPGELQKKNYGILAALIFTLIGAGLLYAAIVAALRSRRFGKAWFELQTLPARPGESLRGILHPAKRLEGVSKLTVALVCQETIRTTRTGAQIHIGSGRHRHRSRRKVRTVIVWETKIEIPASRISTAMDESPVQIEVPLPVDARSSQIFGKETNSITWRLSANAELVGPDFSADFEVPVYAKDSGRGG